MNNNPIFSIIVPVYNVEPYLEHCLQSIANQTFQNIEVILVYDISNDRSLSICQNFLGKYPNFSLFYGEKKGVGAARNHGFNQANGVFICYVDSDDWIEPNLCSDMLLILEKSEADFVNFGFDIVYESGKVLESKRKFSRKALHGEDIFRAAMLDDDIYTVVWNKIYRRSFLIENQIFFPEVKEWEDILFSKKVAYFSHNTDFVSNVYYHQLFRNDSRSKTLSSGFFLDGMTVLDMEHQFILARPDGIKFENLYRAHFIHQISFYLIKAAFQVPNWDNYLQCFETIRNSVYSMYIKESEVRSLLPRKNLFMIFLCKYPRILRFLSSILKRVGISPY